MADDFDSYRFPHLDDTKFPDIDTVDVYEYKNDFDYDHLEDDTKVRLCNVLWSSDYSNVVKFDDDAQRDAWFDSLDSFVVDLKTAFNVAPDNSTKIPVPYQVATRYNYLYVELPVMTSADSPIDYETDRRTKRFYYFVDDLAQLSPNTTRLLVTLDAWTTYINNVDIPYMMLERGHAPMTKTDVNTYLRNPLQNNSYLLAPDFDFSRGDDVVSHSEFYPVNAGSKWVVMAMTMSWSDFTYACSHIPSFVSNATSPATYYDLDRRDGYQLGVSDYKWNVGGYDYSNANVPVETLTSTGQLIPNGHILVAIASTDAMSFMNFIADRMTYLFRSIDACFVVDDLMIKRTTNVLLNNEYTLWYSEPANDHSIGSLNLSQYMFNYPTQYSSLTKLYTFPYCSLEISDNDGNVTIAKVENTIGLDFRLATSLAYPYMEMQAYVDGVNGLGSVSYKWVNLNDSESERSVPNSDFAKYMWKWDIPTYGLYVSAYDENKTSEYFKRDVDRYNAVMDYQKSVKMRNIDRENAVDSANTTQTMTNNSANTEQTNAGNQASAIVGNAGSNTARNSANTSASNTALYNTSDAALTLLCQQANSDNSYTKTSTDAENQAAVVAGIGNGVSGILSAASMGPAGGAAAVGAVAGAVFGSIASTQKNDTIATAAILATTKKALASGQNNVDVTKYTVTRDTSITANNNSAISAIASRDAAVMNTNASNTANTKKNNATLNRNVLAANASYTRNGYVQNAQTEMEQKRKSNLARYASDRITAPVRHASYEGDATLDAFARRGLQVRVRTQPSDCIAQTGDMFLRYGYALNRVWDVSESGLELMSHFTYWKCADIWINEGVGVNQRAMQDIQRAFLNGVTIWNEPTEVGKVSIYDNEPA